MKRVINSAQLSVRLIQLTIDGDNETFGGEDSLLVESVVKAGDLVTVKLKGHAKAKNGRSIQLLGLYLAGASAQEYEFTSSNEEDVVFTTTAAATHGTFGVTLFVNDAKHIYEK